MEKENTDLIKLEKKNMIIKGRLSEEYLFIKQIKDSKKPMDKLYYLYFSLIILLIYVIGFFRRAVTWFIFAILNILESFPNIAMFILLLIVIVNILFKFNKSKFSFLFGFVTACLVNYILYKIKILYIPLLIIKYIAILLKKIYFLLRILLTLLIANYISLCICLIFGIIKIRSKIRKVYTSKDKEYLMELLNKNESLFILYSTISDPNNDFYMQELSELSAIKKGKFVFIMIHFDTEFEKHLYNLFFNKFSEQPKFGVKKGNKKKFMEPFPKKINFSKTIKNFVDEYECGEFDELKEINENLTNKIEVKKEEEKVKENDKEEDKKNLREENVE